MLKRRDIAALQPHPLWCLRGQHVDFSQPSELLPFIVVQLLGCLNS